MEPELIPSLVQSAIAGIVAGIAFWATVRTEIKYLRRDVDQAHQRISKHEEKHHGKA